MTTLHLENVPEDLYARLEYLAALHRRPVAEEVVGLLRDAVVREMGSNGSPASVRSQQEILEEINSNRYTPAPGMPDSVDLLREDRSR